MRAFLFVLAATHIAGCHEQDQVVSSPDPTEFVQCTAMRSSSQSPTFESVHSSLSWNSEHQCYATVWRIPYPAWIPSGNSGGNSFTISLPRKEQAKWIDPLVEGEDVVVQSIGFLETYRVTGRWGENLLQPTGETLHGMTVMRFDEPSRQRILIGDGFAIMAWLPDDGPFTVERAGISNARIAINSAAEAFVGVNTFEYPYMRQRAVAIRSTLEAFRLASSDDKGALDSTEALRFN